MVDIFIENLKSVRGLNITLWKWKMLRGTVPLKTMEPFARGKILSLPNVVAANSPWWDENRNRGKDESNQKPR